MSFPIEKFLAFFSYRGRVNLQDGLTAFVSFLIDFAGPLGVVLDPCLTAPFAGAAAFFAGAGDPLTGAFPAGSFFPSFDYKRGE